MIFLGSYKELVQRASIATQLAMYAFFQQAVNGPASAPRNAHKKPPSRFQFVARSMFDAWRGLGGMPTDEARRRLSTLVKKVSGGEGSGAEFRVE